MSATTAASAKESEYENMESDVPDPHSDEESKKTTTGEGVANTVDEHELREKEEIESFEEEERRIAEEVAKEVNTITVM